MRIRSRFSAATLTVTAALLGSLLTALPATAAPSLGTVAVGTGGAVVSDTPQATNAGLAVLRAGGTAADAAVAVAATLGVTDPYVAGIGGGGYLVYYDARTHRVSTIDGRETTPASAEPDLFLDPATGKPLSFPTAVTSGLSVGVPGTLMTWQQALSRWGRFRLADVLRPAEQIADQGFPVTATLREQTRENAGRFAQFGSTSALFLPGGQLPEVGSTMRNPDLAATYRQLGREGADALYGGSIGADVVRTVHNLPLAPGATLQPRPGLMQLPDLAAYRAPFVAPTHVDYRGYDVYGMAPSSSGGTTVGESLNILGNFDLAGMSRVQALHHYLEATRLAFADRNRYVGDSAYTPVPLAQLLSPQFGRQRACLIDPAHASTSPVAPGNPFAGSGGCSPAQPTEARQPDEGTQTNHFVVTDRWGNVASYTNTIEELGGSGIVVPHRGFLLNNELTDFDFTPLQAGVPDPNLPAGGKRPRSSMSPTIVLRGGEPWLALGSPGGATIITTVLQILLDRIDFGMSLPEAIAAPRASQRNAATTQVEPAFLADPAAAGLQQLGQRFAVSSTSPLDPTITIPPDIGVAAGLEFLGHGQVLAAGEPTRRGGTAAGVVAPRR
ncbi:gamma-glutamyltransferase [Amycolatopsis acidiphila]|uniref:Glutathione hydrolase proenzyme n=1 Tax=Amycolatopsis acidiphila TaxID=715473 RepID=A0A558A4M4_9PSEU|nr:gamma-glutamyltransferase [Amycolatopsis acidiphila]TVT19202.1 gamma-glutamyltransferase [Amycolatopsis acidiphila]UIJ62022.1 gamma-glutamyltransferase [Amycolatopsis acidiphila]GHG56601.1 gamma-glutamyltranspeptidase [Amycolatopsis acidiphila]